MEPHLDDRDDPPPHPPLRRASKLLVFFPQNFTNALCCRRQSTSAPCMMRKSVIDAHSMKGKRAGAPFLRRKSANPPRGGKRATRTF